MRALQGWSGDRPGKLPVAWLAIVLLAVTCAAPAATPAHQAATATDQPPLLPQPAARSIAALAHDHDTTLLALIALGDHHSEADRRDALGALTRMANHGDAFAEYVIGSLYMWGPQRPHALLPYDVALAREYLGNAAVRGNLSAMEALAQFELLRHHPLHAMIWAQLLAYYHHQLNSAQRRMHGYLPELIARAQRQLSDTQKSALLGDVNGVIVRYGARIEAALHAPTPELTAACRTRRIAPQGTVPDFFTPGRWKHVPRAASLMMIYAVDPAGRIVDHAIINVLPNWHVRYQMRYPLAIMRFNPAPGCDGLRTVIQPMHYIDHRHMLRWP